MADQQDEPPLERTYRGDPLIGRTVGEYVVRERIGTGGAGIVYRGEHPAIGKPVAIKVLKPELAEDPQQMRALLDEARAVNAIGDRGIVDVFGFGQLPDGRQYLVMEYLQGERLEALYRERKLGIGEVLSLLEQILRALAAAHGAGVLHRDLKPQNIFAMKSPDGTRYIKLLDFGLARRMSPTSRETSEGSFSGSPNYMSPEQIRRESLTVASDLYSVGAIGFELLTGRPPFSSKSTQAVFERHLSAPIPSAKALRPDVPADLDALLCRLLAKRALDRPGSADLVRAELAKIRKARALARKAVDPRKAELPEELSNPQLPVFQDPPAREPAPKPADVRSSPTQLDFPLLPEAYEPPSGGVRHASSFVRMLLLGAGAFTLLGLGVLWVVTAGNGGRAGNDEPQQSPPGSTAQLLSRIDGLLAEIQQAQMFGRRPPTDGALLQLRRLRIEALATKGPLEVARVDRLVTEWERQNLRPR